MEQSGVIESLIRERRSDDVGCEIVWTDRSRVHFLRMTWSGQAASSKSRSGAGRGEF